MRGYRQMGRSVVDNNRRTVTGCDTTSLISEKEHAVSIGPLSYGNLTRSTKTNKLMVVPLENPLTKSARIRDHHHIQIERRSEIVETVIEPQICFWPWSFSESRWVPIASFFTKESDSEPLSQIKLTSWFNHSFAPLIPIYLVYIKIPDKINVSKYGHF